MIISEMSVQYICPGCGKIGMYSVYGLHEKIEKLYEKNIKHHVGNKCMECHKTETVVRHAEMKLYTIDTRRRYELEWHCKNCGRSWSQYRYLTKGEITGEKPAADKGLHWMTSANLKSNTDCTCNDPNPEFFLMSFVQK